jgi:hypothetical protein
MKKLFLFLCLACCVAFAQVNTVNGKVTYTSTVPSGSCSQNNQAEFIVPTGALWSCQNGTWTQIGGSGTGVSLVSGTTSQIDVATGTTTPVISLDAAIILPGSLTVPNGASIAATGSGTIAATSAPAPALSAVTAPQASVTFTQPSGNTTTFNGTAPGSSAGAGTAGTNAFTITQPNGGATTGSATTAGAGAPGSESAGAGGSGAGGTNAIGGAGGSYTISGGAGGASSGSAVNSNGGNIILSPGAAGTGGGGAAGTPGLIVMPVGNVTTPTFQATGSVSNTGWAVTTNISCWDAGGTLESCGTINGQIVADGAEFGFSQTGQGNGSVGANVSVVGSSTTEYLKASTPVILPQCKIAAPVTLSTTTTICTWTLPNAAQTFSYHCMGTYSTSASSITLLLGTQFAQAPSAGANSAIIWSAASTADLRHCDEHGHDGGPNDDGRGGIHGHQRSMAGVWHIHQ